MTYRVICKYCPDVGTFRGKRGAWRVVDSYRTDMAQRYHAVNVIRAGRDGLLLVINSLEPKQRNSWCNPRSILAKWQTAMRG